MPRMRQTAGLGHRVVRCAELAPEAGSAKEAGRYAALITAIATCRALLAAQCMPCGRSVMSPERPYNTMRSLWPDIQGWLPVLFQPWCEPVLQCERLPTNGYIITTLPIGGGAANAAPARCLPWFGTTSTVEIAALMVAWWNGPPLGLEWSKRAVDAPWLWTHLKPMVVPTSNTGGGGGGSGGGDCGGGGGCGGCGGCGC